MNINGLFSLLKISEGVLALDESNVGSKIHTYLQHHLDLEKLVVEEPVIQPPGPDDTIHVSGISHFLGGEKAMEVDLLFTIDNVGRPDLALTATRLGLDWKISDAFSQLADGYFDQIPVAEATLTLSTANFEPHTEPASEDIELEVMRFNPLEFPGQALTGISCSLDLHSTGVLRNRVLFTTEAVTIHFTGNLRLFEGKPIFIWKADTTDRVSLGDLPLDLEMFLVGYINVPDHTFRTGLNLLGNLHVQDIAIQVNTLVPADGNFYTLFGIFENLNLPTLDHLISLGGEAIRELIKNELNPGTFLLPETDIQLKRLGIGLTGSEVSFVSCSVNAFNIELPGSALPMWAKD